MVIHSKALLTRCPDCDGRLVDAIVSKSVHFQHDNKVHEIQVDALHVLACETCGSVYHDAETADQIEEAVRATRGLMTCDEMYSLRSAWDLTLAEVSRDTGIAESTLSKFENGRAIQSKVYDNILRVYYQDPAAYGRATTKPLPKVVPAIATIGHYGEIGTSAMTSLGGVAYLDASGDYGNCNYALAA